MDGQQHADRFGGRARLQPRVGKRAESRRLPAELVTTEEGLLALRPAWETLHEAIRATEGETFNPFASWTWTWQWWRGHAGRSALKQPRYRLNVVVMRDHSGAVRSIVPFVLATWGFGPLAIRALRLFGFGTNTADLRAPLVWPGWEDAVADTLAALLRSRGRPRFDMTILDGLADGDRFTERLEIHARSRGWAWASEVPHHLLELPATWEDFRKSAKGHLKKSIRHAYNSLARGGHSWTFEVVADPEAVPDALQELFRMHAARADRSLKPRHVDYYARQEDRATLEGVAVSLAPEGSFAVARLRIDGRVVASRVLLLGPDAIYLHDSGADPAWARYAVATTLTAECLRWGIERGARYAYLGTGKDPSKSRWRGRQRAMRRLRIVGPTARGLLLAAVLRVRRLIQAAPIGLAAVLDLPIAGLPEGALI